MYFITISLEILIKNFQVTNAHQRAIFCGPIYIPTNYVIYMISLKKISSKRILKFKPKRF